MWEREINISPMVKWLTKQFDKQAKKNKQIKQEKQDKKNKPSKQDKQGKQARNTKLLWGREFKTTKKGLDEKQVVDFVNDLMAQHGATPDSLLETTETDDEQLAASIKMKAQQEAETEAERIINQAKQEVQEIKLSSEIANEAKLATEKEAENILSTVRRKTEIIEAEAKQRTILYLLRAREEIEKQIREDYKRAYSRLSSSLQDLMSEGQNIEVELKNKRVTLWESKNLELKEYESALLNTPEGVAPILETEAPEEKVEEPAQLQEEAPEEKVEEPAQLQEEAPEEKVEEPAQEEILSREETDSIQLKPGDSQTLYTGEVELAIAIPVELKMVSKLYNYLQTIPDIKILRTTGTWDRGTTITIVADKPIPLISKILEVPDVKVTPELSQNDSSVKGTSGSLLKAGNKEVTRIKLTLKEA